MAAGAAGLAVLGCAGVAGVVLLARATPTEGAAGSAYPAEAFVGTRENLSVAPNGGVVKTVAVFHRDGTYVCNTHGDAAGLPGFSFSGTWSVKDRHLVMRIDASGRPDVVAVGTVVSNEVADVRADGFAVVDNRTGEVETYLRPR